jgi:hypothetical protein
VDATLRYTQLGFALTALLDRNEGADPSETGKRIQDGTLFAWLAERFAVDLSLYGEEDEREVLELFASLEDAADSARKFGVRHNGLALLVAYCFEGLQQLHFR